MDLEFVADAREILDARFQARERGLADSRKVIRASANGIRALHRGEWDLADELLGEAQGLLQGIVDSLSDNPELTGAGFAWK